MKTILASISAYKGSDFIGLRCLEMMQIKIECTSARNISMLRNLCWFKTLEIGDSQIWTPSSKTVGHIQKRLSVSKFAHNLEGPYVIREAYDSGYFFISETNLEDVLPPVKANWLKLFYP